MTNKYIHPKKSSEKEKEDDSGVSASPLIDIIVYSALHDEESNKNSIKNSKSTFKEYSDEQPKNAGERVQNRVILI